MYQDLHVHTRLSDGVMNYKQVLDLALKNNVSAVAFTDHDLVPEKEEMKRLSRLKSHPVKWLLGVELTADAPQELNFISISNLHIVGLFIDPENKKLINHGREIVENDLIKMRLTVKNLNHLGFKITAADCLKEVTGKTIQKPHLVAAILKKEGNVKIVKEFIEKVKQKAKKQKRAKEKYEVIVKSMAIEPENPFRQPLYELFLGAKAFFKGINAPGKKVNLDFDESVALIRNAGGLAILAHWSECKDSFPLEIVDKICKAKRIDGAEIVYDLYRVDLGEGAALRYEQSQIKKLLEKYGLLASGGSDCHKPEDMNRFFKVKWLAGQTIGLVEKMLEQKPFIEYSNFQQSA